MTGADISDRVNVQIGHPGSGGFGGFPSVARRRRRPLHRGHLDRPLAGPGRAGQLVSADPAHRRPELGRPLVGPGPVRHLPTRLMAVALTRAVTDLCEQLGLAPADVARLEIQLRKVVATVYKRNDAGKKYIGDDGEAAVVVVTSEATWTRCLISRSSTATSTARRGRTRCRSPPASLPRARVWATYAVTPTTYTAGGRAADPLQPRLHDGCRLIAIGDAGDGVARPQIRVGGMYAISYRLVADAKGSGAGKTRRRGHRWLTPAPTMRTSRAARCGPATASSGSYVATSNRHVDRLPNHVQISLSGHEPAVAADVRPRRPAVVCPIGNTGSYFEVMRLGQSRRATRRTGWTGGPKPADVALPRCDVNAMAATCDADGAARGRDRRLRRRGRRHPLRRPGPLLLQRLPDDLPGCSRS